MAEGGRDLAAELRVLAELVIDRLEPVLRRIDADDAPEWQGCSWCPFCALAAALRGEKHDLVTLVSTELDGVLDALRVALRTHGAQHPEQAPPEPESETSEPSARPPTYQPITVTIARERPREKQ